ISWAWAALSAVIFSPAVGTPLVDHHAFLFALAAIVSMLGAGSAARPTLRWALTAVSPALLAASFLSKPSLTPFVVPLLALAVIRASPGGRLRLLAGFAIGMAGTLTVSGAIMLVAGIRWAQLGESLWSTASGIGRDRLPMMADRGRELWSDVIHGPLLTPIVL